MYADRRQTDAKLPYRYYTDTLLFCILITFKKCILYFARHSQSNWKKYLNYFLKM